MIHIPKLIKLKPSYTANDKEMFEVCNVLDFYLEKDSLIYPTNNAGGKNKIKCIKNYDKYKIFGYKTSGVLSSTIYFMLEVCSQELFMYYEGQYTTVEPLKEWIEYLLAGGNIDKAREYNDSLDNGFNPFEGI